MSDGRTHYADDETIAYIAKLEAERDEALQREAKNADKLKHYRMYFIAKLEAERDELIQECEDLRIGSATWERQSQQLRAECDRLREALGDAARSLEGIRSHAGLDPYLETMQQVRGFAESRAIAAHAALTQQKGGEDA